MPTSSRPASGVRRREALAGAAGEVLDTFAAEQIPDSSRGRTMLPWPNRIDGGRYTFGGVAYQAPINEVVRTTAIHGRVYDATWAPRRRARAAITLGPLHAVATNGYPSTLDAEVTYRLTRRGLRWTLDVRNVGEGAAPSGAGLHPYVQVSSPTVDADLLRDADGLARAGLAAAERAR